MTRHDDMVRLRHMLDHAREAVSLIEGKHREDLDRERLLELSLTRLIPPLIAKLETALRETDP